MLALHVYIYQSFIVDGCPPKHMSDVAAFERNIKKGPSSSYNLIGITIQISFHVMYKLVNGMYTFPFVRFIRKYVIHCPDERQALTVSVKR